MYKILQTCTVALVLSSWCLFGLAVDGAYNPVRADVVGRESSPSLVVDENLMVSVLNAANTAMNRQPTLLQNPWVRATGQVMPRSTGAALRVQNQRSEMVPSQRGAEASLQGVQAYRYWYAPVMAYCRNEVGALSEPRLLTRFPVLDAAFVGAVWRCSHDAELVAVEGPRQRDEHEAWAWSHVRSEGAGPAVGASEPSVVCAKGYVLLKGKENFLQCGIESHPLREATETGSSIVLRLWRKEGCVGRQIGALCIDLAESSAATRDTLVRAGDSPTWVLPQ